MRKLILVMLLGVFLSGPAFAAELVINGSFETGDFTNWTTSQDSNFFYWDVAVSGDTLPGAVGGFRKLTAPVPSDGTFLVVFDENTASVGALYQDVAIPAGSSSATFSADVGAAYAIANNADQIVRLDITDPAADPLVEAAGILETVYVNLGSDGDDAFHNVSLNLNAYIGQTVRIRFYGTAGSGPSAGFLDSVSLQVPDAPIPVGAPIDMGSDNGAQVYSNEIEVIH